ncbi:DEAD/DEAH box helicase [Mesorhizobium sp. M0915]|uniref:DEAD/DEAH box helicase n=2 Tax=Mesorhizobium TaxID=68287 RepID=UPI0006888D58|nr:DEAD/DEAH box helicase [Mesorhizobium sp. LSHC420B00]
MIGALIDKVWQNPVLAQALGALEQNWLVQTLHLERSPPVAISKADACRYIEAAAILACSELAAQRLAAYRIATYTYDLFRGEIDGLEASVRAVLTRLGNFPSLATEPGINSALSKASWAIAEEEVVRRAANEVEIAGAAVALTDFQVTLWRALSTGESIAISAPTSTGKSFILQAFIAQSLTKRPLFSACYIVPTRALITQVHGDLSDALAAAGLSDVEVVTVPLEEGDPLPEKAVYVLTQERLQLLLLNHPTKNVDFLVIDEAHSVQDGDRGIILQSAIDDILIRGPSVQLLFASPTVSNLNVFSGMTGRKDVSIQATEQVTVSQNFINMTVTSPKLGRVKVYSQSASGGAEVGVAEIGQQLSSRVECLVHIAQKFGADKQSIVYANGQADAEKIAFQISDLRSESTPDGQSGDLDALAELAKEAVHPKYILALTVKNGVAFHYGNIPTVLRNAIEQSFISGALRYIVCTSTLLSGVNLPARNLFMCLPQRMKGVALESVDFWNLAGRAGRLRREFQGNIYLIDYDKWTHQPLAAPKSAKIVPAIEHTIHTRTNDLDAVIQDSQFLMPGTSDAGLETIFVKLLADYKRGRIGVTLDRANVARDAPLREQLENSLAIADQLVPLSADVIAASPTISAHRQQRLYDSFVGIIDGGGELAARELLLKHPRETKAFDSYVAALALCHGTLLRRTGSIKQNRFFALMLLKWMQGMSISELVDGRTSFYPNEKIDTTIRSTLDLVEQELRFNYVRAFGCYNALLSEALKVSGHGELCKSMPSIALYLEIGASDKTMISFIALGLSRLAAKNLTNICPIKTLDVKNARAWLSRQDLEILGFSTYIRSEVNLALKRSSVTG